MNQEPKNEDYAKHRCYGDKCLQPTIGRRVTDDGVEIWFCEWHFSEDFIRWESQEESRQMAEFLLIVQNNVSPSTSIN